MQGACRQKIALITGITGQDGSYLAELLLNKGYQVHGIVRRSSATTNTSRIDHLIQFKQGQGLKNGVILHHGDLLDSQNIIGILQEVKPDEIYHLAAQSHVKVSFEMPHYTLEINSNGTMGLFEAILKSGIKDTVRVYNACTSEMFGKVVETPQTETTPFCPQSPYGIAKVSSYWFARLYRDSHQMFITNGILFNHESPRRGSTFVTKKTTETVAKIKMGLEKCLFLGNLDSQRDWGHAREYVDAMWLMLQHDKPDDFVVATNKTTSVKEMVTMAFSFAGMEITWKGEGIEQTATLADGQEVVKIDPSYYRPAEVDFLLGDPSKVRTTLGWEPKITVRELIKEMVEHDLESLKFKLMVESLKRK